MTAIKTGTENRAISSARCGLRGRDALGATHRRDIKGSAPHVYVVTHRLPVVRWADGAVHAEDGGVPVLLRGLVRTLADRGVRTTLISDVSESHTPLGASRMDHLLHHEVMYDTIYVNVSDHANGTMRWMERLLADRAIDLASDIPDRHEYSRDVRPYATRHAAHMLRTAALHDSNPADVADAARCNELIGERLSDVIRADRGNPMVLVIGPGLAGIGRILEVADLPVSPRCIYWLDSPWVTTHAGDGGELVQAPTAATMLAFDALVLQTDGDRAAVTASLQTFAPAAARQPTLHVMPALPNIAELEMVADVDGTDEELAAWRKLPGRLTTGGNHLPRRNMHGQVLAFAHLLSTRPDLLGNAQLFVHVQAAISAEAASAEIHALRKTCAVINRRYQRRDWKPVVLRESRDRPLEMELMRRCTVLLAIAASEGMGFPPLQLLGVNGSAVAVVSQHTGAVEVAGRHLLIADAASIQSMSTEIGRAIDMSPSEVRTLVAGAMPSMRGHTTEKWAAQMVDLVMERSFERVSTLRSDD